MTNKFVKHAVAFKGSSGANSTSSPAASSLAQMGAGPSQTTDQMLAAALQKVQQLESRLALLEAALTVLPNGDVELFAPGALRIDASLRVEIVGMQSVKLQDSQGNSLVMNSSGVTTTAAAKLKLNSATHELSSALVKVSSALSEFTGVVKCTTLTADTVSGKTYTPGAGNVW